MVTRTAMSENVRIVRDGSIYGTHKAAQLCKLLTRARSRDLGEHRNPGPRNFSRLDQ